MCHLVQFDLNSGDADDTLQLGAFRVSPELFNQISSLCRRQVCHLVQFDLNSGDADDTLQLGAFRVSPEYSTRYQVFVGDRFVIWFSLI